jgi:hypothetical protein
MTLALACALWVAASQPPAPSPTPAAPASRSLPARPGDVDTIEHVVATLYEVISGPAGPRDWDRFRSLFHPDARLIPSRRGPDGTIEGHAITAEGYVERGRESFTRSGFFERGVNNRVERFDHMAHVWSTYESRRAPDEPKPFQRGINSIDLLFDGTRWWILTVYWQGEDAAHPIPPEYLPKTPGA